MVRTLVSEPAGLFSSDDFQAGGSGDYQRLEGIDHVNTQNVDRVHGTAVAVAVMDIAPEAEVSIATPMSSAAVHDVVDWPASRTCFTAIVRSASR